MKVDGLTIKTIRTKMKTKITPPKFDVGQKLYAYTKEGMTLVSVRSINIRINDEGQKNTYFVEPAYEIYEESQLFPDYQRATKRLADNANQLSLLLT